jgi:serine/threonine-protein kinase
MALAPGTRLGPYEVVAQIGAGGMGEVYRARDTQLQRDVAIKVLPEALAHDAGRLARFEREATTLAALNHPNIAHIYGLQESDGTKALVMELVEGPTLADRIAHGAIPIDEALPIARQIAEALEAAHEEGIIHRDLKPANVKVRPDGIVKVLDFGLAKALDPPSSGNTDTTASPTITSPALMTRMGVIVGTAAYMSPEQAKGRAADKRSDMWAFGCVLYEMLTGVRAFAGDDVSDTLAAVLRGEPDWTALPHEMPVPIRRLLRHCLAKDPKVRIADASTARIEIIDVQSEPETSARHVSHGAGRHVSLPWASAVALVTLMAGAVIVWIIKPNSAPSLPVARSTIPLPQGDQFSNAGVHLVALSADGSQLAYTANQRVYLRRMDQLEATPLRGTEGDGPAAGRGPFFSPDGQWIGFWQQGQLKKVSITGGAPLVLCAAENPFGARWLTDNTILYGQAAGIWRVSSEGGTPEHLVKVEAGYLAASPQMLPGGRAILFTLVRFPDPDTAQIVVQSLDSGERHVVVARGADAQYVPTGHLIYALDGTLLAVPFDVSRLAVTGTAVPLEDVAQQNVTAHFAISNHGALVYVPRGAGAGGGGRAQRMIMWVDRQGHEDPIKAAPPHPYLYPRLSPEGTRVALEVRDQEGSDIWIWDLARENLTRLTLTPTFELYGVWTPDGKALIFASSEVGAAGAPGSLFRQAADGTGTVEQLTQGGAAAQYPSTVTPDGTALIFRQETRAPTVGTRGGRDLFLLPLAGERHPRPLVHSAFEELNGEVSRDGHWLAYEANESGRSEIYVRPFPNVDAGKWQVSTNGGTQPLWARNGQELFYESMGALMRVPVKTGSSFEAGTPRKLFDAPYLRRGGGLGRMYDVSLDGQRFLMIKEINAADERPQSPRINLVQNWFEELKRLVPTK